LSRVPTRSGGDLDIIHGLVLNGVGGEVDGTDIIIVNESAFRQRSVELLK
jgi:hypothetical protein